MQINPFVVPLPVVESKGEEKKNIVSGFSEMVRDALQDVNRQQLQSEAATKQFLTGELEDIHQLLIAGEQARLSLQLTVQVTTRIIDAYREIARMQI
jgi:flagellar hook-basal body complex protein FliE